MAKDNKRMWRVRVVVRQYHMENVWASDETEAKQLAEEQATRNAMRCYCQNMPTGGFDVKAGQATPASMD